MIGFVGATTSQLMYPRVITATITAPDGTDIRGYTGELGVLVLSTGATAGSTQRVRVKLQDSADNATFADVDDTAYNSLIATSVVSTLWRVEKNALDRYLNLSITVSTTVSTDVGIAVQLIGYPSTDA